MQFSPLEDRVLPLYADVICWRCMHSLRGVPGRFCPQCGAERGDARVRTGPAESQAPPRWAQRYLQTPGAGYYALVSAGCVAALMASAVPGWLAPPAIIAIGLLPLLAVVWGARVASLALVLTAIGWRHAPPAALRRLIIAPMMMVFTIGMVALDVPSRAALRLSRPAMDRWVKRVLDGKRSAMRQQWIGLYPARDISLNEDGVWFRTPGTIPNGGSGFVYSPNGWPEDSHELTFRRRGGGWYEWVHHF